MKKLLFRTLLALSILPAVQAAGAKLPFIQDDFAKARAEAVQRNLPIFVECWAPW